MHGLLQDLTWAWRQMRRAPTFSFFVIATLAIGIGANATIFSAASALLLRPLPWAGGERLVSIFGAYEGRGNEWSVSLPDAADWRERARSFDGLAWFQASGVTAAEGEAERLTALRASAGLLPMLGMQPLLGRTFTEEEAHPDGERVVVLSHALWQRRYGGAPDVLGTTVMLSGRAHSIIGVLPPNVAFPDHQIELYLPLRASTSTWRRGNGGLQVVARLRPGVDIDQAQRELDAISADLAREYPASNAELSAALRPFRDVLYGGSSTRAMLYLLLGGVAFVLLIGCVNVANLLLARASSREREVAVRAAMGAGRGRIVRQLLTESLVFAIIGGAAGVLLATWTTRALAALIPASASLPRTFSLDPLVLGATAALTLATGLAFGLAPVLHAQRVELATLLARRAGSDSRARSRRRGALVIAEVALATMLLIGAGLMLRSMATLVRTDPGFQPGNLLTMRVALDATYETPESTTQFQQRVLEELRTLPGVVAAAAVDFAPLSGTNNYGDFRVEGDDAVQNAGTVVTSPGYTAAMGIPLLRGRDLDARDARDAPGVVLISRSMAERYWPGEDALGRRILLTVDGGETPYWRTVVGIVGDVRHGGLDNDPRAEMHIPAAQLPWTMSGMTFVVRTAGEPLGLVAPARAAIATVDPRQALFDVRTMQRMIRDSGAVLVSRLLAGGLALFATVALILAALGVYGVLSYMVAQRTYEIGVRTALGATRGEVLLLVLRRGLGLVGVGLLMGSAAALGLGRVLRSTLHGVAPTDPVTFAAVAVLLLAVALAATALPARRAAAVDPLTALRAEG